MNAGIEAVKKTEDPSTLYHAQQINSTPTKSALFSTPLPPPSTASLVNNEQMSSNLYATETAGSSAAFFTQCDDTGNSSVATAATTSAAAATATATVDTSTQHLVKNISDSNLDSSMEHQVSVDPPSYEESQSMLKSSINNNTTTELTESAIDDSDGPTTTTSESEDMESESDDDDTDDYQNATSDTRNDDDDVDDEKMINDSTEYRTELSSSVVPPTSISLEITASHETDTAQPDTMNSSKSSELLEENDQIQNIGNKVVDGDEIAVESDVAAAVAASSPPQAAPAQIVVSGPTKHEPQNYELNQNANVVADDERDVAADTQQPPPNERFIKPIANVTIPITFETAATMDDVSDTELESYLQELEDLEDNSMGLASSSTAAAIKVKSDSLKSANGSLKSDDNDIEPYDAIYNIGSASDINQMVARDDRNADSFSQASTVEFGEVNATNSSNEQLPCSEQIHAPAAPAEAVAVAVVAVTISPPSVNSALDVDDPVNVEPTVISHQSHKTDNATSEPTGAADAAHNEINESDDMAHNQECSSSDGSGQQQNECLECEIDQQIMSAVKRPNSLNLQNCNSTVAAAASQSEQTASSSALNFSSDDNAGNTPPASGLFLSSSISSDDSNIGPTDNNQMAVSNISDSVFSNQIRFQFGISMLTQMHCSFPSPFSIKWKIASRILTVNRPTNRMSVK